MATARSVFRATVSAIGGAFLGAAMALMFAQVLGNYVEATTHTDAGGPTNIVAAVVGVPLGMMVGAIAGALSAESKMSSPGFRRGAIAVGVLFVALFVMMFITF